MRDVRSRRHNRRQLRDVRRATDLLEHAAGAQRVGQRDRVDRLAVVGELRHRAEDLAMRLAVEIFRRQNFERVIDRVIVEQNRAQHGLFCLEILRRNALQNIVRRYRHLPTTSPTNARSDFPERKLFPIASTLTTTTPAAGQRLSTVSTFNEKSRSYRRRRGRFFASIGPSATPNMKPPTCAHHATPPIAPALPPSSSPA